MGLEDPGGKRGVGVPDIDRRTVLRSVGVAGAVGVLGTGSAAARHQDRGPQEKCDCIDDEETEAWGKYDFVIEEDEDGNIICYFEHTEGEDVVDLTGWEDKEDEECEPITVYYEPADGYTVTEICAFGGNDNHEDEDPDDERYDSDLVNPGEQQAAISNLTFCVEEEPEVPPGELPGWQVDLIHGDPIVDFAEEGTYNEGNRLLQALWAHPDDPTGRLEDQHFAQNDDAYADCDANIVQDITFDPDTGMATATLDPGECACDAFDLVSYDAPGFEWQGGEDQIFHQSAQQESTVEDVDDNCVFTVEVPHGGGD